MVTCDLAHPAAAAVRTAGIRSCKPRITWSAFSPRSICAIRYTVRLGRCGWWRSDAAAYLRELRDLGGAHGRNQPALEARRVVCIGFCCRRLHRCSRFLTNQYPAKSLALAGRHWPRRAPAQLPPAARELCHRADAVCQLAQPRVASSRAPPVVADRRTSSARPARPRC